MSYAGGEPTGWLSAGLGTTEAPTPLTLRATTGTLAAGSYHATVSITAPAGNSPQTVAVTFTVAPPSPLIVLNPTAVSFTAEAGAGNPAAKTVPITNGGGGTLSRLVSGISYQAGQPTGWLQGSLSGTTAPATLTLSAATGTLAAGSYSATVTISSALASNSPRTVAVTFTVTAPTVSPAIGLSTTSRTFSATAGGANPTAQSPQVANTGGGSLTGLQATENPAVAWLSVSLSSTTAPATLTFQATTGSLAPGTYTTSVLVTSPVASNSPQTVTVTFNVQSAPPVLQTPTVSGADVTLTWSFTWPGGLSSTSDGYLLERSTSPTSGFTQILSAATHNTPYMVTVPNLSSGTHYFRVGAVTRLGTTGYSAVQSAVVGGPSEITVFANEDNSLIVSSTDPTLANTVYRLGTLQVGCNFSVLPFSTEYVCGLGLMRFPVQSQIAGRTILSAELRLYPFTLGADQQTSFRLGAVTHAWTTTTVTANSLLDGSEVYSTGQSEQPAPITTALPYTFDVTTIVRNWANGSFANHGLLLWDTAGFPALSVLRSVAFDSADDFATQNTRPQRIIRFQ